MKLVLFSFLIALINGLNELTYISSTSQFISDVGAEKIPWVTIIASLLTPVCSLALDKMYGALKKYYLILAFYSVFLLFFFFGAYFFANSFPTQLTWAYAILSYLNTALYSMIAWNIFGFYFNVFETRTYFFYFTIAGEAGAMIADILVAQFFYAYDLRAFQFVCTTGALVICLLTAVIALQKPLNFQLDADEADSSKSEDKGSRSKYFFYLIIFISLVFQIVSTVVDYQFNVVIEDELKSTEKLNKFISIFQVLTSIVIIAISYVVSNFFMKTTSVVGLLIATSAVLCAGFLALNALPIFYIYCAVAFIRVSLDNSIFYTAFSQLTNTLSSQLSLAFRNTIEGKLSPVITLAISGTLLLFPDQSNFSLLNVILLLLGAGMLFAAYKLKKYYTDYHRQNLSSADREQVMRSAQALGEYHNFLAIEPLLNLLERQSNDKSLSKEVIVSLGKIKTEKILSNLFEKAYVNTELVQSASLDSIANINSFGAQRFLIEFLNGGHCKSLIIRERLIKLLYDLVGVAIIPQLLPFLENKDARVVANTIEAMTEIKDERIILELKPFLNHSNNRVRANTILVLYKFKQLRKECEQALSSFLNNEDPVYHHSYLYVVGKLKLHKELQKLKSFMDRSEIGYRTNLAFALSNINQKLGFELFSKILLGNEADIKYCLHHFIQLNEGARLKILGIFANACLPPQVDHLAKSFEESPLDFDNEIQLLKEISKPL